MIGHPRNGIVPLVIPDDRPPPPSPSPASAGGSVSGHARDRAIEAAIRLIAAAWRRDGEMLPLDERPRFSIPCRPDYDDDTVLLDFLKSVPTASGCIRR